MHRFGALIIALWSSAAMAATVKKINKTKGIVLIDAGKSAGLARGDRICFFSKNKRKAACGKIVKIKTKRSIVRVSKRRVKRIKPGFRALKSKHARRMAKKRTVKKPITKAKPQDDIGIAALVHFLPLSPAVYNNISYLIPSASSQSLWETDSENDQVTRFFGSVGGEISILPWHLVIGGRYSAYKGSIILSDVDPSNKNLFMETDISAFAIGGYIDFFFFRRWGLGLGVGLDVDVSSVDLKAIRNDDTGTIPPEQLYTLDSTLTVFSIRIPVTYTYLFHGFGAIAGVIPIIPVYSPSPSESPTVPDPSASPGQVANLNEALDLEQSLDHRASSFALDIIVGLSYQF